MSILLVLIIIYCIVSTHYYAKSHPERKVIVALLNINIFVQIALQVFTCVMLFKLGRFNIGLI